MILGAVAGGLAVGVIGLLIPRRKCPDCAIPFPRIRIPANARQAMWGGFTCPKCGCEVDRNGRKVPPAAP